MFNNAFTAGNGSRFTGLIRSIIVDQDRESNSSYRVIYCGRGNLFVRINNFTYTLAIPRRLPVSASSLVTSRSCNTSRCVQRSSQDARQLHKPRWAIVTRVTARIKSDVNVPILDHSDKYLKRYEPGSRTILSRYVIKILAVSFAL